MFLSHVSQKFRISMNIYAFFCDSRWGNARSGCWHYVSEPPTLQLHCSSSSLQHLLTSLQHKMSHFEDIVGFNTQMQPAPFWLEVPVCVYHKLLFYTLAVPGRGVLSYHAENGVPVLRDIRAFRDWSQDLDPPAAAAVALGNTSNIQGLLPNITERVQVQTAQTQSIAVSWNMSG